MVPKSLPRLTILAIDNVAPRLTALALADTLEQIMPQTIVWETDPSIRSMQDVEDRRWGETNDLMNTSHQLCIQYDGFVLDASRWQDSWLEYDYIGAPWPWYQDDYKVGNGGFSLRSNRLMKHLRTHDILYPVRVPEDDAICRLYRPRLEAQGFKFAPLSVAAKFSFEREAPRPTFGFHGIFNIPKVLSKQKWNERYLLLAQNSFVNQKSEFIEACDWLYQNG